MIPNFEFLIKVFNFIKKCVTIIWIDIIIKKRDVI